MIQQILSKLETNGSAIFKVKIIPKSSRNEIIGSLNEDTLKIKVTAAPEKNKANEALIKLLANTLKIPPKKITIISGQTSQQKLLQIIK
jgi:uncharacterized protein